MYLIVGAKGFLGSYLIKNILEKTDDKIIATDIHIDKQEDTKRVRWIEADITNNDDIKKLNEITRKDDNLKIIYLAAYHHPDLVLKNPKIAWAVNVIALANFLNIMDNVKALYYPSTEVVYGTNTDNKKFTENDRLCPSNKYGEHKVIAETMVKSYGYNVVRFPVLMGKSLAKGKKHFFDEIIETLQSGNTIEMFTDNLRSIIDFNTASKLLIDLIENPLARQYKVVNIASDNGISKYDFAILIAQKYNLDKSKIIPISMDDKNQKIFTAKRAKETLLDNSLLKQILNISTISFEI